MAFLLLLFNTMRKLPAYIFLRSITTVSKNLYYSLSTKVNREKVKGRHKESKKRVILWDENTEPENKVGKKGTKK